ncbi:hypothetical protein IKG24_00425 [Candidatus Saccharibacteria bacterium]|nr:hypothetical protein [Candidatus Saccharibacteria bacterium]
MDSSIKASIDARKNAITNAYKLDEKTKKEVDDLFVRIEKLGAECKDAGEFENKLAASPLNQEYINMFTKVATADASTAATQDIAKQMVTNAAEGAIRNAVGSTIPTTRAAVNQKVYDAARDIPGVGDAIDIGQKASYIKHLGKVFGRRKDH